MADDGTGDAVRVAVRDRIATVTLDRGDGRNPLSYAVMRRLTGVALDLAEQDQLSAIVLTGTSDVFSVGFDLKDPLRERLATAGAGERLAAAKVGQKLCRAWAALEPLTVVAVEGHCIGGGVALAVACDLIVAGEGARFLVPEIDRGMNMSWQSVPRIANLVGPARAKRICILAEPVDAATGEAWGLVQYRAAAGGAFDRAMAVAEQAAAKPPIPVRMIKRGVEAYVSALAHATSQMDADQFALATMSDDYREGVESFLEKRRPRYTGN
ncbi:MAG: enoyl-CoA hydratase/isomerase family protein [Sneathiellaceae bacterium]